MFIASCKLYIFASYKRTSLLSGHIFWSRGCPLTGGSTVHSSLQVSSRLTGGKWECGRDREMLYSQTSRKRIPSGPEKNGRLREVSAYGRLKMQCLYAARNMTMCPLTRVVRLREVSVSVGSSIILHFSHCFKGKMPHFLSPPYQARPHQLCFDFIRL